MILKTRLVLPRSFTCLATAATPRAILGHSWICGILGSPERSVSAGLFNHNDAAGPYRAGLAGCRSPFASLTGPWMVTLFLVFATKSALQGQSGWTQPAGGHFIKADWSSFSSAEFATQDGEQVDAEKYTQHLLTLFSEFGLSDRLTLVAQGPLLRLQQYRTTRPATGMGDLRLDLKYRITSDRLPVSFSLGAEAPTGDPDKVAYVTGSPQLALPLPTGDGEWNFWATLAASRSWGNTYLSGFGAANLRTANARFHFVNLYQAGLEFGFRPSDPLWLSVKLRAQYRQAPGVTPAAYFLYSDGTTYTLTSLEAFYAFHPQWGATLAFFSGGNLLSKMRNLYLASVISLGIVHRATPAPANDR